jgi:hypothetical protein
MSYGFTDLDTINLMASVTQQGGAPSTAGILDIASDDLLDRAIGSGAITPSQLLLAGTDQSAMRAMLLNDEMASEEDFYNPQVARLLALREMGIAGSEDANMFMQDEHTQAELRDRMRRDPDSFGLEGSELEAMRSELEAKSAGREMSDDANAERYAKVAQDRLRAVKAVHSFLTADEIAELGDGAIVAILAQRYLHDHTDTPVSAERYTVVIQQCPDCNRTDGHNAEVRDTLVAEACCDAVRIDARPGPDEGRRTRTIPQHARRRVLARDAHRCVVPGCTNRLWLDLHHLHRFAAGGDHGPENLVTLCSAHHRLHHEGRLALERIGAQELRIGFANGRVHRVRLGAGGWASGHEAGGAVRPDLGCGGRSSRNDATRTGARTGSEVAHGRRTGASDPRGSP